MKDLLKPGFTRDLFRLDGKVALIIGGRGTLAEVMATTLADLGCDVALASRHESDCEQTATDVASRFGRRVIGLRCDVAHEEEIERTVVRVTEQLGEIGILINNSRLTDLRSHMDSRFDDMRATWHSELRRVEEVLDARLKHLEER